MAKGSRQKCFLIPAASGVDCTTDPAHLAAGRCQQAVNLIADMSGILRNQALFTDTLASDLTYPATGLGMWHHPSNAADDIALIVSDGNLYTGALTLSGPSPQITPTIVGSGGQFNYGIRNRMLQMYSDTAIFSDDGSNMSRWNGSGLYTLGLPSPGITAATFTYTSPAASGKTFTTGTRYCGYRTSLYSSPLRADLWLVSGDREVSWTAANKQIALATIGVTTTAFFSPLITPGPWYIRVWATTSVTTSGGEPAAWYLVGSVPVVSWYLDGGEWVFIADPAATIIDANSDSYLTGHCQAWSGTISTVALHYFTWAVQAISVPAGKTTAYTNNYYAYVVTFVDEQGRESNYAYGVSPSTVATVASGSGNNAVQLSFTVAAPGGAQNNIVGINLYCALSQDAAPTVPWSGPFFLVNSFTGLSPSGSPWTITYTDQLPDTTLGEGQVAPNPGENSPPNGATIGTTFMGHVILDDVTNVGGIQVSNTAVNQVFPTQFASVPVVSTDGGDISVGDSNGNPIMALVPYGTALAILKRTGIYYMAGTDITNYAIYGPVAGTGCIAKDSVVRCESLLFYLADDGVYSLPWSSGFTPTKVSKEIETSLKAQSRTALENAIGWYYQNAYYLAVQNIVYRLDLAQGGWTFLEFPYTKPARPPSVTAATSLVVVGYPAFEVVGVDTGTLPALCTYYPNGTTQTVVYQTAQQGDRGFRKRIKKVRLFGTVSSAFAGSAVITGDATNTFTLSDVTQGSQDATIPGCLVEWCPTSDCVGFLFDVTFNLSGQNLEITDCAIFYEELDMLEGIREEEIV